MKPDRHTSASARGPARKAGGERRPSKPKRLVSRMIEEQIEQMAKQRREAAKSLRFFDAGIWLGKLVEDQVVENFAEKIQPKEVVSWSAKSHLSDTS